MSDSSNNDLESEFTNVSDDNINDTSSEVDSDDEIDENDISITINDSELNNQDDLNYTTDSENLSQGNTINSISSSDSLLNSISIENNQSLNSQNSSSNGFSESEEDTKEDISLENNDEDEVKESDILTANENNSETVFLTNDFLDKEPSLNNIDSVDKDFLKSLISKVPCKKDSNDNFTNDIFNILFSSVPLKSYIQSLVTIYNNVKDEPIYVTTKFQLASKIASIFKTVPIQRYFSKTFLDDDIVDYFIKKHLFYDNILSTLLIRNWGLDYFKFKPSPKHLKFYQVCCQKLYTRLNLFIQNSNYYSFRHADFTTYINFILLMASYTENLSETDGKTLFDSLAKLLFMVIHQLYTIITTSRNSIETLDMLSDKYIAKYINRSSSDNKSRLQIELRKCNATINDLFLLNNDSFTKIFCNYLKDFDYINHTTHPNYSEVISILPYLSNNWWKHRVSLRPPEMRDSVSLLDNLLNNIYISNINSIFKSTKVNVHNKVHILSDSSYRIFSDQNIITNLIEYYSEIEKYDENSGFYEKDLARFHIVRAILEFLKPSKSSQFSPDKLYYQYEKDTIELDNIHDKLKVFENIESHKLCSFITLLISEITDNFVILETSHKSMVNDRVTISLMYKFVNSLDNVMINYELISLLMNKKNIHNSFIINKFCELINTILTVSFKIRLYCQLKSFSESSLNLLPILSDITIENLNIFYNSLFTDLHYISENDSFIDAFVDNESLYDRKCLENTEKLVGFLPCMSHVENINLTIGDLLNRFMSIVDKRLYYKNQTLEKYDDEIPSDFLDPIYYIPIENPIEMPNTKTIVEKKIIMNHLVFNQTNPFDGLPLTRDEIIEYNKTQEVKQRLEEFVNKFKEWKNEHKIE